ncbi:MAG: hypothetical protein IIT83_00210, partial [Bacteroidales bacterium]|nr:hypothetical protein [Bacteroidales bacterium]
LFVFIFQEKNFKEKYLGDNRGCAIPNMPPMDELKKIKFICPPLPLQQKFAEKIEAIEKHKQIVNVTIKDLETLLASRMQFWFE